LKHTGNQFITKKYLEAKSKREEKEIQRKQIEADLRPKFKAELDQKIREQDEVHQRRLQEREAEFRNSQRLYEERMERKLQEIDEKHKQDLERMAEQAELKRNQQISERIIHVPSNGGNQASYPQPGYSSSYGYYPSMDSGSGFNYSFVPDSSRVVDSKYSNIRVNPEGRMTLSGKADLRDTSHRIDSTRNANGSLDMRQSCNKHRK